MHPETQMIGLITQCLSVLVSLNKDKCARKL